MSDPLTLVARHFWALGLLVALVYGWSVARRARGNGAPPETGRRAGLVAGISVALPFLVMAAGSLVGGVPSAWHYLRPRDGDPWVLAFHATVVLVWAATLVWVFALGGDRVLGELKLIRLRGLVAGGPLQDPRVIRLFTLACIAGGCAGLGSTWVTDIPLPR